jgi:glyoxylase-like metal-dependent hydrolase (beta-lactamase superfamily II)
MDQQDFLSRIAPISVGALSTNCYVVRDNDTCLVVDPGAHGAEIARAIEHEGLTCKTIVCTHGHHDHVGGVAALKEATGATYMISEGDAERATRAIELSSHVFDVNSPDIANAPEADVRLKEGDVVSLGDITLRVIEAPGHTEGGIVLMEDEALVAFVGDTIFEGSVGRTDLVGGDAATLKQTIARLKEELPSECVLLSGHGNPTTMGRELMVNPWFL